MGAATLEEADVMVRSARAVAIMMPSPGISTGGTPIMMQGDDVLVRELFGTRNRVFSLKDGNELNVYLYAQAILSPTAKLVSDAAEWLGKRVLGKAQGEAFLRAHITSNLFDTESADLIEALNTPGGYNQRLRLHMEANGMGEAFQHGLDKLE